MDSEAAVEERKVTEEERQEEIKDDETDDHLEHVPSKSSQYSDWIKRNIEDTYGKLSEYLVNPKQAQK